MLKLILSVSALILSLCIPLFAQLEDPPSIRWVRYYETQAFDETSSCFNDIFAIPGGGYVLGGYVHIRRNHDGAWLLVTEENGDPTHDIVYEFEGDDTSHPNGYSVIKTDDGSYLMGGRTQLDGGATMNYDVIKTDRNGEEEWWEVYSDGGWGCHAVIELKQGNYVASGQCAGHQAYAVMINEENGEIIWENTYDGMWLFAIREVQGAGLVFAGYSSGAFLLHTDYNGEVIWSHRYEGGSLWNLISCPDGGFAACGQSSVIPAFFLIRTDNDGNLQWSQNYPLLENGSLAFGLAPMPDGGFVMAGYTRVGNYVSAVVRVDAMGNVRWQRIHDELPNEPENGNALEYGSVIVKPDGSIILAGQSFRRDNMNERLFEGVVVCLEPDRSPPHIVEYSPDQLEFDVLLGDSTTFWIRAEDLQDDSLSYEWYFENDLVDTDTFTVVHFEELGDFAVKCVVFDGEAADSILWRVHVCEFYISEFMPDSLEMNVRRGRSVDFSVACRALVGDPVNYLWTMTDLNTRRDTLLGETDSITVQFTKAHDFRIEGIAYRNQSEDAAHWLVHCCSTIWEWWPRELELSLTIEDTTDFSVYPFNPDSDSLLVEWSLDDEMFSNEWDVNVIIDETGDHEIKVVVNDGCESDTLAWQVNVYDPDGIAGQAGMPVLPEELTLYPAYPNPFNAEATVRFYIPEAGNVKVTLCDISGRISMTFTGSQFHAGENTIRIDAGDLPAGIYLIRLESGGNSIYGKAVLVK